MCCWGSMRSRRWVSYFVAIINVFQPLILIESYATRESINPDTATGLDIWSANVRHLPWRQCERLWQTRQICGAADTGFLCEIQRCIRSGITIGDRLYSIQLHEWVQVINLADCSLLLWKCFNSLLYMVDCFIGPEFLCENHRCISFYLRCDGFDHCGDGSDEKECPDDVTGLQYERPWYAHTSNYFFPKVDHLTDLKTTTLVFLASSVGLMFLIIMLIVVLHRMGRHVREQRHLQQQIRTISGMLGMNPTELQIIWIIID